MNTVWLMYWSALSGFNSITVAQAIEKNSAIGFTNLPVDNYLYFILYVGLMVFCVSMAAANAVRLAR